mmetsp:Transcript_8258/g.21103  ORF Transcript_8258/g.21103 Transcript_8258/m.21103 type:complete len:188 (+) Transcript_8258:127-690(+)
MAERGRKAGGGKLTFDGIPPPPEVPDSGLDSSASNGLTSRARRLAASRNKKCTGLWCAFCSLFIVMVVAVAIQLSSVTKAGSLTPMLERAVVLRAPESVEAQQILAKAGLPPPPPQDTQSLPPSPSPKLPFQRSPPQPAAPRVQPALPPPPPEPTPPQVSLPTATPAAATPLPPQQLDNPTPTATPS